MTLVQEIYFQPVSFTMMAFSSKSTLMESMNCWSTMTEPSCGWMEASQWLKENWPVRSSMPFGMKSEQAWRVAGWREELRFTSEGVQRTSMPEIPVHILSIEERVMMLLNNGEWIDSAF